MQCHYFVKGFISRTSIIAVPWIYGNTWGLSRVTLELGKLYSLPTLVFLSTWETCLWCPQVCFWQPLWPDGCQCATFLLNKTGEGGSMHVEHPLPFGCMGLCPNKVGGSVVLGGRAHMWSLVHDGQAHCDARGNCWLASHVTSGPCRQVSVSVVMVLIECSLITGHYPPLLDLRSRQTSLGY